MMKIHAALWRRPLNSSGNRGGYGASDDTNSVLECHFPCRARGRQNFSPFLRSHLRSLRSLNWNKLPVMRKVAQALGLHWWIKSYLEKRCMLTMVKLSEKDWL